jgi:glycosyltransferase involved in cell wall biosynthesis
LRAPAAVMRRRDLLVRALAAELHSWLPARGLAVVGDGAGWVLDQEARELVRIMRRCGYRASERFAPARHGVAFFASREQAIDQMGRWRRMAVAVCMPYYHGYPGCGEESFDRVYEGFRRHHEHVARVQVTHERMRAYLLETGISPAKVHTIRIGVDAAAFMPPAPEERAAVRKRLGIPASAVVIGSFQKDGVGWGEGSAPKAIKGPDVLLKSLALLKERVPELFVLLSGPARGFVRQGLTTARVPFVHVNARDYREMPALYHGLDAYVVASRQEGGPKAVLESMAVGVPIVSTRVGQAAEIILHGQNGWLTDVDDVEAIAHFTLKSLNDREWLTSYRLHARRTAEENAYQAQAPLWVAFFEDLLSRR